MRIKMQYALTMVACLTAATVMANEHQHNQVGHDTAQHSMQGEAVPKTPEAVLSKMHEKNQKEIEIAKLAQEKSQDQQVIEFARMLENDHKKADEKVKQLAKQKNIDLKKHADEMRKMDSNTSARIEDRDLERDDDRDAARDQTREQTRDLTTDDTVEDARADVERDQPEHHAGAEAGEYERQKHDMKHDKKEELKSLSGEAFNREFTTMMAKGHAETIQMLQKCQQHVNDSEVDQLISNVIPTLQKHEQEARNLAQKFGANLSDAQTPPVHNL